MDREAEEDAFRKTLVKSRSVDELEALVTRFLRLLRAIYVGIGFTLAMYITQLKYSYIYTYTKRI